MKSKNIIYIIETKLTKNDVRKFGANYFEEQNHKINYLNISPVTRSYYYKKYSNPHLEKLNNHKFIYNFEEFKDYILKFVNPEIFLFISKTNIFSKNIINFLNQNNTNYYSINSGLLPIPVLSIKEKLYHSFLHPFSALSKIFDRNRVTKFNNFKPNITFINNKNSSKINKKSCIIPSYDYDEIILWERNPIKEKNLPKNYYIFFETPYSHPDGLYAEKRFPPERPCSYKNWYYPLNKFLKKFIELTNSDIIIIPHPRTTDECLKAIKFGEVSYKNKIDLVRNCKGIMTFASSALSFGVYFDKPILFLNQSNFTFHNRRNIKYLIKYFKTTSIDMNDEVKYDDIKSRLVINKNSYYNFKHNYLGFPSKKTSYELILNLIEKNH